MTNYDERPKCRKAVEQLLKDYQCDLETLLHHQFYSLSKGIQIQTKKMLQEKKQQQIIDKIEFIKHKGNSYPIMLCEVYNGCWRFYCPFCMKYHSHSPYPGHRCSHCMHPFLRSHGYFLKLEVKQMNTHQRLRATVKQINGC